VYTVEELLAITELAHSCGMYVHMDGARLANAAAYLGVSLKALTTDCGIDVLSFGGTKNGLMMGESVVIINPTLIQEAKYIRKQSAQLASKMRYLACQFSVYLRHDFWLNNARHANTMAQKLYHGLKSIPGVTFTQKVETNALFLVLPKALIEALQTKWFFYFWNEDLGEIRLVTSFDTTDEDVEALLDTVRKAVR